MEVEFRNKEGVVRNIETLGKFGKNAKESVIIHSGKTEEENIALWNFIEDALSRDITIICRNEGHYIMSREATGSAPYSTYECLSKSEEETNMCLDMIKKHLGIDLL